MSFFYVCEVRHYRVTIPFLPTWVRCTGVGQFEAEPDGPLVCVGCARKIRQNSLYVLLPGRWEGRLAQDQRIKEFKADLARRKQQYTLEGRWQRRV